MTAQQPAITPLAWLHRVIPTCGLQFRHAARLLGVQVLVGGCCLLAGSGCHPVDDPQDAAAMFAVRDLMSLAPGGFTPYLASQWQVPRSSSTEPVPPDLLRRLQEASGLPLILDSIVARRDSTAILLYMFRPIVVRPDSVMFLGGWMGFRGGDGGGAWGTEYRYLLDCRRKCRLLAPRGASSWN
jgi:hypothetical protein